MKDGKTGARMALQLVVDDPLAVQAADCEPEGLNLLGLSDWRATLFELAGGDLAVVDPSVIGLCLSAATAAQVKGDTALAAALAAADIPLRDLGSDPSLQDILTAGLTLLSERHGALQTHAAADQRAMALLRRQHMQIQDDYADLETWVWDHLAPKHFVVRDWPVTAQTIGLKAGAAPIRQLLPAPVRGFIAVDLHIAQTEPEGTLHMRAIRPNGPAFDGLETAVPLTSGPARWITAQFPRAGGGAPEDVAVEIWFEAEDAQAELHLSLAPESPFEDFCLEVAGAVTARPLALRVRRTLPRMPAAELYDTRQGLPADGITRLVRPNDLSPAEMLPYYKTQMKRALRRYPDRPEVANRPDSNDVLVQPSVHRPVGARISGLKVSGLTQARAIVQNSRHDTMPVAFALGVAPQGNANSVEAALEHIGQWVHLLPAEWGEVWCDLTTPLEGKADLLLLTAMPNMPFNRNADALFHGFRLTARAAQDAG